MKRFIAILTLLLTVAVTNTSSAQTPLWSAAVGRQLADGIQSESPGIKSRAIQQTHYYAVYNEDLDLKATVPALVDVYENDPDPKYRVAAVATLHAIGDETGMQDVRRLLTKQTDRRVQMVSIAALRDAFGLETFRDSDEVAVMAKAILADAKDRERADTAY